MPLRVDFDLHPASRVDNVLTWPISPASVEAMVLYDATGGRLTARVGEMVGRSLRPADPQAAFERVCGDFWYFLLYVHCKLGRGERWVARQVYHSEVLEHLLLLLRLEAGATDRWEGAPSAWGVERALSPGRLARLDACIPATDADGVCRALPPAARLGREVCAALGARHGWPWPERLADRTAALLASAAGGGEETTPTGGGAG